MSIGRIKKETEEKGKRNMLSLAICLGHWAGRETDGVAKTLKYSFLSFNQ